MFNHKYIKILCLAMVALGLLILGYFQLFLRWKNTSNNYVNVASVIPDPTKSMSGCKRDKPFVLEPEFENALNTINKRSNNISLANKPDLSTKVSTTSQLSLFPSLLDNNCIDISYSDNFPHSDTEFFWFDEEKSTPNALIIKVRKSPMLVDNLAMVMLLAHELTHIEQYLQYVNTGVVMSCQQKETEAYIRQIKLLSYLNKDEWTKITEIMKNNQSIFGKLSDLWVRIDKFDTKCKKTTEDINQLEYNTCYWNEADSIIGDFLQKNIAFDKYCFGTLKNATQ